MKVAPHHQRSMPKTGGDEWRGVISRVPPPGQGLKKDVVVDMQYKKDEQEEEEDAWRQARDEQGNIYWWHKKTREVTWTPPHVERALKETARVLQRLNQTLPRPSRDPPNGEGGGAQQQQINTNNIREVVNPSTGLVYYYNTITRESFWTDPRLDAHKSYEQQHDNSDDDDATREEKSAELDMVERPITPPRPVVLLQQREDGHNNALDPHKIKRDLALLKKMTKKNVSVSHASVATDPSLAHDENIGETTRTTTVQKEVVNEHQPIKHSGTSSSSSNAAVCLRRTGCTCPACAEATTTAITFSTSSSSSSQPCLRRSGCMCQLCAQGNTELLSPLPLTNNPQPPSSSSSVRTPFLKSHSNKVSTPVASKTPKSNNKDGTQLSSSLPKNASKWRRQSEELRIAMGRGKVKSTASPGNDNNNSAVMTTTEESTSADEFVPCPHCLRRFNPKAAERHIPKCTDIKSKPTMLKKGGGKAAFSARASPGGGAALAEGLSPVLVQQRKRYSSVEERGGASLLPCLHCGRQFSVKVLDRHSEHCSSMSTNVRKQPMTTSTTAGIPSRNMQHFGGNGDQLLHATTFDDATTTPSYWPSRNSSSYDDGYYVEDDSWDGVQ